jgi:hypothetical protein
MIYFVVDLFKKKLRKFGSACMLLIGIRKGHAMCVSFETRSRYHCCEKTVNIAHSQSVFVASLIRNTKLMRRVKFSSGSFLSLPYYSALFHKRHDFQKKSY